jgi:hypothetical protein
VRRWGRRVVERVGCRVVDGNGKRVGEECMGFRELLEGNVIIEGGVEGGRQFRKFKEVFRRRWRDHGKRQWQCCRK